VRSRNTENEPRSVGRAPIIQPTRKRITLWASLALIWLLFLPQDLAMDPQHEHFSWIGAILWLVVLVWLASCLTLSWRGYRRAKRAAA
jgi:uncharacterized membrane protein